MTNEIKYFSMFTGVGGFELGLANSIRPNESDISKRTDSDNSQNKQFKWKCVGMSEWDKYSSQVLKYRFPNIKNWGDCTKINPNELPDFDMLCGGFPCQAFSIAGKRRGFEDTRGTMFFEVARILKVKKPKIVLLENVKGLLNHNKGETFSIILEALDELGYEVQWMVLNSKFFGVPQNRERILIIGSLRGEPRPEILPFGYTEHKINKQHRKTRQIIQVDDVARENKYKLGNRLKEDGTGFTLNSIEQRGIIQKTEISILDLYNNKEHTDRSPSLTEPHHNTLRVRDGIKIRRLTPIECERLQGFPYNWTEYGITESGEKVKMSDTQRYKQMGNAVTTNVIKAVGEKILNSQTN